MRHRRFASAIVLVLAGVGLAAASIFGPGPNSTVIPSTSQNLSIILASPPDNSTIPIPPGTVTVTGNCAIGTVPGQPINVVYIVDVSGSTDRDGMISAGTPYVDADGDSVGSFGSPDAGDDFNGDGEAGETLDGEIAGVIALNGSIGNPANVRVGIVAFATNASGTDPRPAPPNSGAITTFYTSPPQVDASANLQTDIVDVLRSLRSESPAGGTVGVFTPVTPGSVLGNNTNFNAAITSTNSVLTTFPSGTNLVFFLSDGQSNVGRCVTGGCVAALNNAIAAGTKITTIGIGAGADAADLTYIANLTGGQYVSAPNPSLLSTILPALTPAGIQQVLVDGTPVTIDGLGNFSQVIDCADHDLNPFNVTATCYATDNVPTTVSADITLQCFYLCGNGTVNPEVGEECEPPGSASCDASCQRIPDCGDTFVDAPEQCEPPSSPNCDASCLLIQCGNGIVQPGEECEPPNTASCDAGCQRVASCGDGFVDAPEGCDPPDGTTCDVDCTPIVCGNGEVEAGEQCDPGNPTPPCTLTCQRIAVCNDGFTDAPETCDPPDGTTCDVDCTDIACGNADVESSAGEECDPPAPSICDALCHRIPTCGDSFIDTPEECEPPNSPNCDAGCLLIACGNNVVQPGEECDPPSTNLCDPSCQRVAQCGDTFLDAPETCDPPNGTTCDVDCTLIECGNGQLEPGEECEPPNSLVCDGECQRIPVCGDTFLDSPPEQCEPPSSPNCDAGCLLIACGNGLIQPGEECDPPNTPTCDAICQRVPVCNDGFLDNPSEQCEPPNTPTCSASCQFAEVCSNGIDDDGDTLIDCLDSDCPVCPLPTDDPSKIKFDRKGTHRDQFSTHGKLFFASPIDPATEGFTIVVSNTSGIVYRATVLGSGLTVGSGGFRFKDKYGVVADGITALKLAKKKTYWTYTLKAVADLSAASDAQMTIQVLVGDDAFSLTRTWKRRSFGWFLPNDD